MAAIAKIFILVVTICTLQQGHADWAQAIDNRDILISTARQINFALRDCVFDANQVCTHDKNILKPWRALVNKDGFIRFRLDTRYLCTVADEGRTVIFGNGTTIHCEWTLLSRTGGKAIIINRATTNVLDNNVWEAQATDTQFSRVYAYPEYTGTDHHHWFFDF